MGLICNLLGFSKSSEKTSSEKARDRLRIIVESDTRSALHKHMPKIQQEIFSVLARYLGIPQEDFSMQIDEEKGKTTLELFLHFSEDRPSEA